MSHKPKYLNNGSQKLFISEHNDVIYCWFSIDNDINLPCKGQQHYLLKTFKKKLILLPDRPIENHSTNTDFSLQNQRQTLTFKDGLRAERGNLTELLAL